MLQLIRIKLGEDIEQSHMRNRQMVAQWVYRKGLPEQVIEKKMKDGKTFFVINDYQKLRTLFGTLLREVQRIKSEGDYAAGKELIETYGVKIDPSPRGPGSPGVCGNRPQGPWGSILYVLGFFDCLKFEFFHHSRIVGLWIRIQRKKSHRVIS